MALVGCGTPGQTPATRKFDHDIERANEDVFSAHHNLHGPFDDYDDHNPSPPAETVRKWA